MGARGRRATRRTAILGAAVALGMVVAAPGMAAAPTAVDFTIAETIPVTTGTLVAGTVPGCSTVTVITGPTTVTTSGPNTVFEGTKIIDCGSGDTLELSFKARVSGCATTDSGTWKVIGGTGIFATASGNGQLVGTYTGGSGTSCDATGINDNYTGRIKLS